MSDEVQQVREKADIVEIISQTVNLRQRGKNYVGLCPFHEERTPSFTVSAEKQLFHCFGCSEGGTVFDFVMKSENLSFREALEALGEKLGIPIGGKEKEEKAAPERLALEAQMTRYLGWLTGPEGREAREYLVEREIGHDTATLFKLGYCPPGVNDPFQGRLIFPILDLQGRPVGFGGRSLGPQEPKYLNSAESALFSKGKLLYGIHLAKSFIKQKGKALVVEGYMDVIACVGRGISIAVAPLGTMMTPLQARLLTRFTQTVILALDQDEAGETATRRSIPILRQVSIIVKIASYPGAKDPDEYVRRFGPKPFIDTLTQARSGLEFLIRNTVQKRAIGSIEERIATLREVIELIREEPDPLAQKEYAILAAELLHTSPPLVLEELGRRQYAGAKISRKTWGVEKPLPARQQAEKLLMQLAIQYPEFMREVTHEWQDAPFHRPEISGIMMRLSRGENVLESIQEEALKGQVTALLVAEEKLEYPEQVLKDCLALLKAEQLREEITVIKEKMGKLTPSETPALEKQLFGLTETLHSIEIFGKAAR